MRTSAIFTPETLKDPIEQARIADALSALFYALVWTYAVFAVVSSLANPVGDFDDAIPLLHGMLIRKGYTPNLDFYSFYPPLNLYLNAAAFRLLGRSVIATRILADFFYVIVLILVTSFFRSRFRSWGPLVPAAILVVATSIGAAISLPAWPGFALSLAALLVYLCSHSVNRYRLWLVACSGLLTALDILCRINFGSYVIAIIALDLLHRWWFDGDKRHRFLRRTDVTTMAAFALPLVICCASFCIWVYGRNIGIALSQFIVTAQRLMALRGFIKLTFTTDLACAVALPSFWFFFHLLKGPDGFAIKALVPALIAIALLMLAVVGGGHLGIALVVVALESISVIFMHLFIRRLERSELSLLLFFCFLLHYYLSRGDWFHWRWISVAGALLFPFLLTSRYDPNQAEFEPPTSRGTALAIMIMAIFVFVAAPEFRPGLSNFPKGLALIGSLLHGPHSTDSDRMLGAAAPPAAWNSVYANQDELAALRYLRARSNSSTPIFVGAQNHSTIFWNDLRMYWLADRPIGVRTFQLEAKVATEAAVQREIIADLEGNHGTWVILEDGYQFKPSNYEGSKLLDKYIAKNFRQKAQFGPYVILTRASD